MNIQEDYVSFETAKLLKEKGFDGKCLKVWIYSKSIDLENNAQLVSSPHFMEGESAIDSADVHKVLTTEELYDDAYLCPTLQMAMKWLREKHNIHIEPRYFPMPNIYRYVIIYSPFTIENIDSHPQYFNTHEEACEEAIKYCLKNLIK